MSPARNEAELALGRILRLASRPSQPGDVAEYERCRAIIIEAVGSGAAGAWTPNVARDRNRGAVSGSWPDDVGAQVEEALSHVEATARGEVR